MTTQDRLEEAEARVQEKYELACEAIRRGEKLEAALRRSQGYIVDYTEGRLDATLALSCIAREIGAALREATT